MCSDTKERTFISVSTKIHDSKYRYDLVEYRGNRIPVSIICPMHGVFWQTPQKHKIGQGCVRCSKGKLDTKEFIERSVGKHGLRYDYSKVLYTSHKRSVVIICPYHGEFEQRASSHLHGYGCNLCGNEKATQKNLLGADEFRVRSENLHGDRYDYSDVKYIGIFDKVRICCREHGIFEQTPDCHLKGYNCPSCSGRISQHEYKIGEYVESLGFDVSRTDRTVIPPYEVDIYIPSEDIGIEFCGLYWHSEDKKGRQYHTKKKDQFDGLITIFEDEWNEKPNIVKSILANRLGKSERGIPARKTTVMMIDSKLANSFYEKHHIQGKTRGKIHIGAHHEDILIACMTFSSPQRQSQYEWEMTRYATNGKNNPGIASRLFSYFIRSVNPESVVTFADRRWFSGETYKILGFVSEENIPEDYYWVKQNARYHKSKFRKSNIQKIFGIPIDGKTEYELMTGLGFHRIWDCGKTRFVYRNAHK